METALAPKNNNNPNSFQEYMFNHVLFCPTIDSCGALISPPCHLPPFTMCPFTNSNVIFKYFWTIGGILDFQIMGRKDMCFWTFNSPDLLKYGINLVVRPVVEITF
jgi:hypothetical protein